MKVSNRSQREWWPLDCFIRRLRTSLFKVRNELRQRRFGLAEKDVVGIRQIFDSGGHVRTTENDAFAECFASLYDFSK